jgi:hypothetical protein
MSLAELIVSSHTTPVTSQFGDRLTHQVLDEHATQHGAAGFLRTVCGQWIIPASMMSPIGDLCPACTTTIAHPRPDGAARDKRRRRWMVTRLPYALGITRAR